MHHCERPCGRLALLWVGFPHSSGDPWCCSIVPVALPQSPEALLVGGGEGGDDLTVKCIIF